MLFVRLARGRLRRTLTQLWKKEFNTSFKKALYSLSTEISFMLRLSTRAGFKCYCRTELRLVSRAD